MITFSFEGQNFSVNEAEMIRANRVKLPGGRLLLISGKNDQGIPVDFYEIADPEAFERTVQIKTPVARRV
jgi:hypothetical protein